MRADLTTKYLGMVLRNPLVASASPLTGEIDTLCRLEQMGVAAVVLPSLFEEQITRDQLRIHERYELPPLPSAEALTYFPKLRDYQIGPREYVRLLEEAKRAVKIPVVGSLNGCSPGGWARYAKLLEDYGADAIELNVYFLATDPQMTPEEVEARCLELVTVVRSAVSIPVAVKIGSQFSNLTHFVRRLAKAGADGTVLFNRYLEPDIDLETLQMVPRLVLSNPHEMRLPLRWIAILRDQVDISLAATTGIHSTEDVVKMLLVGADVCMVASAFLKRGVEYAADLLSGLQRWIDRSEYNSVEQLRGSLSYGHCSDSGNMERANYMKSIVSYTAAH